MKALIVDTEVNGLVARECIELAFTDYSVGELMGQVSCHRFRPEGKFEAGAVATHGIIPSAVEGCPPSCEAAAVLPVADYLIGHNVDFDADVLGNTKAKRICTLAMARRLWPDFGSHKLGAVYIELFGMNQAAINVLRDAHSADADVLMTHQILTTIVTQLESPVTLETLHAFSEKARVPTKFTFGKHRGERIADVPRPYRTWLLGQPDVDQYMAKALRASL